MLYDEPKDAARTHGTCFSNTRNLLLEDLEHVFRDAVVAHKNRGDPALGTCRASARIRARIGTKS